MFYVYVKLFFAPLVRIYLRLVVEGEDQIPREGPAILVANHTSFLDPIVMGSASRRMIHFIVLQSMYDWWRLRWFYWGMQTIPVRTEEADPRAIKHALSHLRKGELVGIFPEGGRSEDGTVHSAKAGAALLAAVSRAPVIPCHIEGAYQSMALRTWFPRPGRLTVRFGPPLRFPAGESPRHDRAELIRFSDRLIAAIRELGGGISSESQPDGRGERAAAPRLSRES